MGVGKVNTDTAGQLPAKRGGLSGGTLKGIAIAAMLIDHATYAFIPDYYSLAGSLLHFVGRITGPIMFYFIVEGYHHTRNKNQYTLRLAIFAAVSYLPFIWLFTGGLPNSGTFLRMNVIYSLLLGHLALRALHEVQNLVLRWVFVAACFFASGIGDWAYVSVLLILVFDLFRGSFRRQAIVYAVVVVARMAPSLMYAYIEAMAGMSPIRDIAQAFVTCGMFLPLVLLRFYNGQKGSGSKWLFYIFYPAHLCVLALLRMLLT